VGAASAAGNGALSRRPRQTIATLSAVIAQTSTQHPRKSFVNSKDGQAYVWIDPGKFRMGCSPSDRACMPKEFPYHDVEITSGFWLSQTAEAAAASFLLVNTLMLLSVSIVKVFM
jgi:formylglycine-generating enzyme required for sulfatase activity